MCLVANKSKSKSHKYSLLAFGKFENQKKNSCQLSWGENKARKLSKIGGNYCVLSEYHKYVLLSLT